jgi:TonB-dependent receptor
MLIHSKSCWHRLGAVVAAALFLTTSLLAQSADTGGVTGRVFDSSSKVSLGAAEVGIAGTALRTTTARDGTFSLRGLPTGEHTLAVSYLGYESKRTTITIEAGRTTVADFALGGEIVQLEEFRVEGIVEGQARALNQQRANQNISNIIASDAMGQFPDKSIADATRRLPGITIERGQGQGEGRYVTIRGMNADFNAVSLNGVRVTVSNFDGASRSVPLDVVSAKSAESIEVSKAIRPDQDADSIGGAISIRTRSPFDRDGRFLTADVGINYSNLIGDYGSGFYLDQRGYEFSASYGDFLNAAKTWAIAITLNSRETPYVSQSVDSRSWAAVTNVRNLAAGAQFVGKLVPTGVLLQEFFDQIEQDGLTVALEYRPDADNRVKFNASYSERDSRRGRQLQDIRYDTDYEFWLGSAEFTGDTITRFTSDNRLFRQVRDFYEAQALTSLAAEGRHVRGENTFTWLAGFNRGQFDGDANKDLWLTFRTGFADNAYNLNANGDGYFPGFSSSRDRLSPAQFRLDTVDLGTRFITDDEFVLKGDFRREAELLGGRGFWQAGVQGRWKSRDFRTVDRFYDSTTNVVSFRAGATAIAWFLDGNEQNQGVAAVNYGPARSVDGRYEFGFFIDPSTSRRVIDALIASGKLAHTAAGATDSAARSLVGSYQADEDVLSTYIMAQTAIDRWTLLAGVRAEYTDVSFDTHRAVTAGGLYSGATAINGTNDYVDILPGVHARYDVNKNFLLRAAVTSTIARASYRQLNPSTVIDNNARTVTRGRTDLDPTRSLNLDLAAEYYFGGIGLFSATVFAKDMKDNVYRLSSTGLGSTIPGTNDPAATYSISEFRNAKGADVTGLELSYERALRFLPAPFDGLGVFGNFTWVDSEVETGLPGRANLKTPLFGQVETSYNAGVYYQKNGLQVRVAYNWRDAYLDFNGIDADARLDRYLDTLGTLDVTTSYLLPWWNLTVYAEFNNVTNTPDRAYRGNSTLRPVYNEYRDWSASFGLRWRL